jgi:large subunit ribosomal protein L31e
MSQELERVYTINLGKSLLSPDNQRAKRAINMVKEFARHHMKTQEIKIEEDLSHQIWKRGIKHPPRKIRVKMIKTDEGFILVSPYEEQVEKVTQSAEEKKPTEVKEKPEAKIKEIKTIEVEKEEPKPKEPKTKTKPNESKVKEVKSKEPKAKETKAKKSKPKESKKAESKKLKPKKKST